MSRYLTQDDPAGNRRWTSVQTLHPRLSAKRRWGMCALLVVLWGVIGGYAFLTDSERVRRMAEGYLSSTLGGRVDVGSANLSVFEGLRLENLRVYVDEAGGDDALLFSAQTVHLEYSLHALLSGRLEATRIVAIGPEVHLTEDAETGEWNYQRLERVLRPDLDVVHEREMPHALPEIVLRNGLLARRELRGGQTVSMGSMAVEGRLAPAAAARQYVFDFQSRGAIEGVGAVVSGSYDGESGEIFARLENVTFGEDLRSIVPGDVRAFADEHRLDGRMTIREFVYRPGRNGEEPAFEVEMHLDGVTLAVDPARWLSREENRQRESAQGAFEMLRGLVRASRGGAEVSESSAIARLSRKVEPTAIRLDDVAGRFVFTQDGIEVDARGRVEANAFAVRGWIGGYSPDAPAELTVASLETENIYVSHLPRYAAAMPKPVREIYDRLRPEGTCRLEIKLLRATPGGPPALYGEVQVLDGRFVFEQFPYPMRAATGHISFAFDPANEIEEVRILDLRGRGIEDGPNADSVISINGWISPLGPDAGVEIRVAGSNIHSEPRLTEAFPSDVREALELFDPDGAGKYPTFSGDFLCEVIRPMGLRQNWTINTDLMVREASGALAAFPYPLEGVSTRLEIRPGYVDIIDARMQRGEGSLTVDGRINLRQPADSDEALPRVALKLLARDVPMDRELIEALPQDRRQWLERLGIGGVVDIEGEITQRAGVADEGGDPLAGIDYDLAVTLKEGTIWPTPGTFTLTEAGANLHLTPERITFDELKARRGQGELTADGTIELGDGGPWLEVAMTARRFALDAPLYQVLPGEARAGWDQIRPVGTVDVELEYAGPAPDEGAEASSAGDDEPAQRTAAGEDDIVPGRERRLRLVLQPRELSATPRVLPYRLDELTGTMTVSDQRVELDEMTGRHGEGTISFSGEGTLGEAGRWDLKLSGEQVMVDEPFLAALPEALAETFEALQFEGAIDFDFSQLIYREGEVAEVDAEAVRADAEDENESAPGPDIDFAAAIRTNGSSLHTGVPLHDVEGSIDLAGTIRGGKLSALQGRIDVESLLMADRPMTNFRAEMTKPEDEPTLQIRNMQAEIARGELAGQVDLTFPDDGPSRYAVNLVVRNAHVPDLIGEAGQDLRGQLSASVALEGNWEDPSSRRGRGDVRLAGEEMYRIPLMLGLLQITNLSLPTPFNEATARYSVEGQRATFERIDLRSRQMVMYGSGWLDFESGRVRVNLATDNPNWPRVPILHDLIRGARQELLRIRISGTVEQPRVSARSLTVFQTTVDEVFREE